MKIYIGADHRGFPLKEKVLAFLKQRRSEIIDVGTDTSDEPCDYPKIAYRVAQKVAKTKKAFGILVCMSGIGQAIAANKVKGAYAALCYNPQAALLSRQHNNANILVLSAKFVKPSEVAKILTNWLGGQFEGGRHRRRFNQIQRIEKGKSP